MNAVNREEIKRITIHAERPESVLDRKTGESGPSPVADITKPSLWLRIKIFLAGQDDEKEPIAFASPQHNDSPAARPVMKTVDQRVVAYELEQRIALSMGHEGLSSPLKSEDAHSSADSSPDTKLEAR